MLGSASRKAVVWDEAVMEKLKWQTLNLLHSKELHARLKIHLASSINMRGQLKVSVAELLKHATSLYAVQQASQY